MAKTKGDHDIVWRGYFDSDDFENNKGKG